MTNNDQLLDYGKSDAQVNMGNWISRAWDVLFSDIGYFILIALIYILVISVASATIVGEFIVMGPLAVGFYYIAFKKLQGKGFEIGDISKGFNFFTAAVISSILISVFMAIGFTLCIIPGIIICALYTFTPVFILDKKLDFWNAMEASRKVAQKHIFELSIFVIILGLINLLGVILCLVGIFVTIPLTILATAIAYEELVGFETELD
jgi:uncharacterized membrane protein